MFNKILVVCTGNICRSPFAEHMLQKLCPKLVVDSAGTGALVGHPADATAQKVALAYHIDLSQHVGKQVDATLCRQYDLILTMEAEHVKRLINISPTSAGKIMLYGQWLDSKHILDPYRQNEAYFKRIFDKIEQAAQQWQKRLG